MANDNEIYDLADKIVSRKDFEIFLEKLRTNFAEKREDWDNDTIESYLEGLYGYIYDTADKVPTWKLFAEILLAARVYE